MQLQGESQNPVGRVEPGSPVVFFLCHYGSFSGDRFLEPEGERPNIIEYIEGVLNSMV